MPVFILCSTQRFLQPSENVNYEAHAPCLYIRMGVSSSSRAVMFGSLRWSVSLELPLPPPCTGEAFFLIREKRRQETLQESSQLALRQSTSGDDRRILREEAERQARRQLDAT